LSLQLLFTTSPELGALMLRRVPEPTRIRPSESHGGTWEVFFWAADAQSLYEDLQLNGASFAYAPIVRPYGMRESAVLVVLAVAVSQEPAIRFVPQTVDRDFATRTRLCSAASAGTSDPVSNDQRRSVQALLGPTLLELQVHQMGDSFTTFAPVRDKLRALLRARPFGLTRFPNWAEGTPFRNWGLLGTIRYTRGRTGRFEAVGNHLCFADSAGVTWWVRLEVVDVWPDSS
jgi:hypothetical protein